MNGTRLFLIVSLFPSLLCDLVAAMLSLCAAFTFPFFAISTTYKHLYPLAH